MNGDGTPERPLKGEDLKIFFLPLQGQLKIGPITFDLSGIEIDFIQAGLENDQKSLGQILSELKEAYPGFYKSPETITREEIVEAIEMVLRRHPEIVKEPIASLPARLLSKHPVELSGRMSGRGEVVIAFEWVVSGVMREDVGPVATLEAINIFRKLPVNVQAGIRVQHTKSASEGGRYCVRRGSE